MVRIIVSLISTRSSSNPSVEIVREPEDSPEDIVRGDDVIVYSLASAVPDRVKGILISKFDVSDKEAVIVKFSEEFSSIDSELNSKLTVGGLSPSISVILTELLSSMEALVGVWVISVILSSFSSEESSLDVIVIEPVVSPAETVISGLITCFCILWFSVSVIYTLLSDPIKALCGLFNWFTLFPPPPSPAIISPSLAPGVHLTTLLLYESTIIKLFSESKLMPCGLPVWLRFPPLSPFPPATNTPAVESGAHFVTLWLCNCAT